MSKIKRVVLCLVLCIPLVAAIIVGMNVKEKPANTKNELIKVTVTSELGQKYEYSDEDTIDFYEKIISNSTKVSGTVPGENSTEFTVEYAGSISGDTYTFIMNSDDTANCVYKNLNDEYYLISKEDAYSLLLRNEFENAYVTEMVSDMHLSLGGNKNNVVSSVKATEYSWNYKKVDGEFTSDVKQSDNSSAEMLIVPKDIIFDFSFNKTPDYLNIIAKNGSDVIYEGGSAEAFSKELTFTNDTVLNIVVESKWQDGADSASYGEAVYSFDLLYDIGATYTLVDKKLKQGEFTIIRVANGNDGEKITATSDMMDKEMEVFTYNGNKYIYVPISRNATPGDYSISINDTYGPATLKFTVTSAGFKSESLTYRANVITLNTTKSKTEYEDILNSLSAKSSSECLWDGKFSNPVENGTTVCSFGTEMNITGIETRISDGMYISGENGADVKSANNGVVIYAGTTDYMGNAVIVDHGLGLYSYYFNLGSVECEVGDAVTSSTVIGTIGTSGVTPYTDTVFYANSLYGCFINPATQIKYGVTF